MPKKSSRRERRSPRNSLSAFMRRPMVQFGVLLVIALIVLLIASLNGSANTGNLPAEISAQEAYQKYQQGVFLLDVREPEEWNEYHVPNTTLIPLGNLPSRLAELPKDREIVVVCRSGNRSQEGRDILLQAGFNATSMAGGLRTWSSMGYPTVSGP
jgi:rhodanese-related sulfurtransferase